EADGLIIEATGVTGHAAFPNGTRNAAGMMLRLLDALEVGGPLLRRLARLIGVESDGASMGIACHDAASGALTLNLGMLTAEDGKVSATIDIRYPVHVSSEALIRTMRQRLQEVGGQAERGHEHLPLHVPAQHPVVVKLGQVYHELTGGDPAPYSIGGGTYARSMDNCVAFGANFPGREELAHQAGEYVSIEDLMMNVRIFAHTIATLLGVKP
ncbi:MAG TPA: M20/M25/M40 family metallo-hydrolase, partial [Clostridia bacterium]|nr:M20/M25/M40 family metallo-hydrolase [Clostridia bacterium]